jgi:hypothetical protein
MHTTGGVGVAERSGCSTLGLHPASVSPPSADSWPPGSMLLVGGTLSGLAQNVAAFQQKPCHTHSRSASCRPRDSCFQRQRQKGWIAVWEVGLAGGQQSSALGPIWVPSCGAVHSPVVCSTRTVSSGVCRTLCGRTVWQSNLLNWAMLQIRNYRSVTGLRRTFTTCLLVCAQQGCRL